MIFHRPVCIGIKSFFFLVLQERFSALGPSTRIPTSPIKTEIVFKNTVLFHFIVKYYIIGTYVFSDAYRQIACPLRLIKAR